MPRQIHQMLPTLGYGDAIGNHVLALRDLFRSWGYESEIFAERWHPRLADVCHHFQDYRRFNHPDNLVLLHYSIGGEINRYALNLPDRVVLYYHNVTPAHFFYQVNGELARQLHEARQDLQALAGKIPAIAASAYNAQELESMGFDVVGVSFYIITFDRLDSGLSQAGSQEIRRRFDKENSFDWLYIGRLAPNKCIHDIIKSFYYYHAWIQPESRLLLVGTGEGLEPYVDHLYRLVSRLGLDGSVVFAGHYGAEDGLAGFYRMADVYVSMSEHEGFCIPLIEAMHYDLPVVAHASTGVPYTMGQAGVLIHQKDPAVVAEMVHEVEINETLRHQLIKGQHTQLDLFSPDQARAQLREVLQAFSVQAK